MALVLRGLFALTPWGNAFDCLYNILQMPLNAIVGENLFTLTIINLLTQVLWFFGIHPGFLSSMTAPIMFGLPMLPGRLYPTSSVWPFPTAPPLQPFIPLLP